MSHAIETLREFHRYQYIKKKEGDKFDPEDRFDPTSFWISNVKNDREYILNLSQHLNFYMSYFDRVTPIIVILHEEKQDSEISYQRYIFDRFPESINARSIDPYILGLIDSARNTQDVYQEFLYYYQVFLEYSAFYYVNEKVERRLKNILCSPQTAVHPTNALKNILDELTQEKMQDEQKLINVVEEAVHFESLWKVIEVNKNRFSREVVFDGGFKLKGHYW